MQCRIYARLLGAAAVLFFAAGVAQAAPFMIVGNGKRFKVPGHPASARMGPG
jgi:hypothetical protein